MVTGMSSAAGAEDAAVSAATSRVQNAEERVDAVDSALDKAAQSYEAANAHVLRLDAEAVESDAELRAVDAAVANADAALTERVASVYKRPAADLVFADAVQGSPDAGSALHRAALFGRLLPGGASQRERVAKAAALVRDNLRQQRIITIGARTALKELETQSQRLRDELEAAQRELSAARERVTAAKQEARRREQAVPLADAAAGGSPQSTNSPGQSVDGKTCPVGSPNGFIDSWGFPRSGGRSHEGVDMFAPMGTPLYAVADGTIWRVYNNTLGGLAINLIDDAGTMYYYAHMSAAHVTSGQKVTSGQVIGAVGNSGNARGTPPHVHWQVHPDNASPVNPYPLAYSLCRR